MKYHLQQFDSIINSKDERGRIEVGEIIDEIKQSAFSLRTEIELRMFVQNHQTMLLTFRVNERIRQQADEVLYFLETHFGGYVDHGLQISYIGWREFWRSYGDHITDRGELIKQNVSKKLHQITRYLTEPQYADTTITKVKYLVSFWREWPDSFHLLNEERLITYLISQNYNHPPFFRYVTSGIISELRKHEYPEISQTMLWRYVDRLSCILPRINSAYDSSFPEITNLLGQWLNREIKRSEKKFRRHDPNQMSLVPQHLPKLETSMSVAQLACFFKLLNQSDIITNKVQMEILQAISETFRSKKADSIGLESLRSKYYSVEDKTRESVKDMIKDMLVNLESV